MPFPEKIKLKIKKQANFCCCICQEIGVELHHIIPSAEGGPNTEENAAPLCPNCHETYGANPTKRKFIKEAKEHWIDTCKQKLKQGNFINIGDLMGVLEKTYGLKKKEHGKKTALLLKDLFNFLLSYKDPAKEKNIKNFEITYASIFGIEHNKEFTEVSDRYFEEFGSILTKKLVLYIINILKIDWINGISGEKIEQSISLAFALMLIFLAHPEISKNNYSIETCLNGKQKTLYFRYIEKK
ncbi:HNH endonuclease [Candidatus Gracilibacteria bacterium]|nr:HNH endonuclease [Candidatus Gracilibacteria bacterium]